MTAAGRVWYVAYGSNLASRRFGCYLRGGLPAGGRREYVGCRDPTEPTEAVGLLVPGRLVFTGSSSTWGGGTAVLDPTADGYVAGRAYLVTVEQFADVVAQEVRQPPGSDFALALESRLSVLEPVHVLGQGRYETVVQLGVRDGAPLLTATAADVAGLDLAAPTAAYLRWIAEGLAEAHRWPPERIVDYLVAAPGARDAWTRRDVAALLADGLS